MMTKTMTIATAKNSGEIIIDGLMYIFYSSSFWNCGFHFGHQEYYSLNGQHISLHAFKLVRVLAHLFNAKTILRARLFHVNPF